jgi:RNA polymerase sigma-70 factor, ECF subfamily
MEQEMLPHIDALHGYALYLTRKRTEAEELTQETLLKAVNAFSQYQVGTNCKAWLFRIMYNTFLNSVRGRRVQIEFDEASMSGLSRPEDMKGFAKANRTPEESFVNMLSRSKVREAVETLPPDFRAVVVLADLEELSYKEIAEVLSCPIGTVMSRLHRGRKLLRQRLMSFAREMGLVGSARAEEEEAVQDVDTSDGQKITHLAAYRSNPRARLEQTEE